MTKYKHLNLLSVVLFFGIIIPSGLVSASEVPIVSSLSVVSVVSRHIVISKRTGREERRRRRSQSKKQYKTIYHKVRRRENLGSISRKYKVSRRQLIRRNHLHQPYRLRRGRYLNIKRVRIKKSLRRVVILQSRHLNKRRHKRQRRKRTETIRIRTYRHRVRRGESVRSIARGYRIAQSRIIRLNRLRRPYRLRRGQVLVIKRTRRVIVAKKTRDRRNTKSRSGSTRKAKSKLTKNSRRHSTAPVHRKVATKKKHKSKTRKFKPRKVTPMRVLTYRHSVRRFDTLRRLSKQYQVSQRQIIRLNHLRRPYRLRTGRRLLIKRVLVKPGDDLLKLGDKANWKEIKPDLSEPTKVVTNRKKTHKYNVNRQKPSTLKGIAVNHLGKKRAASKGTVSRHGSHQQIATSGTSPGSVINRRVTPLEPGKFMRGGGRWIWPAQGKLESRFSRSSKGIKITGQLGQSILAAGKGKIVYIGDSLIRYGNLVIIKHNSTFFTAYAHNRRLLVREGQFVRRGQKIAEMGSATSGKIVLHFEIRKHGRPVDPLRYLPAK